MEIINKQLVFFIKYKGLHEVSLGFSIDVLSPNIEIHLPFFFIKFGFQGVWIKYPYGDSIWGKAYKL